MKAQFFFVAAALTLTAQAQVAGPNRPGPGTSPGTFSQPTTTAPAPGTTSATQPQTAPAPTTSFETIQPPVVNDNAPVINDTFRTAPRPGALGPDPVAGPRNGVLPNTGISDPNATSRSLQPTGTVTGAVNDSRAWERGAVGSSAQTEVGADVNRLTPIPNGTNLNTTGINTPARTLEQPLDRALSAKIRAQLSASRAAGTQPSAPLPPEIVRDLRITSQNGRIVLEGIVESEAQREQVQRMVKEVQGVAGIENRLTVRRSNKSVGAPASGQFGGTDFLTNATVSGQSPRNSSDLDERRSEIAPDR